MMQRPPTRPPRERLEDSSHGCSRIRQLGNEDSSCG
jgi:hypothetical protein